MYTFPITGDDLRPKIVNLLAEDWPLSEREIFGKLGREWSGLEKTEVYRAVKKLAGKGVLFKTSKKYAVSLDWINETSAKASDLARMADFRPINLRKLAKEGDSLSAKFPTFGSSLYAVLTELNQARAEDRIGDSLITHWYHACPSIAVARTAFAQVRDLFKQVPHYVLCRGNTNLDGLLLNFWGELGSKTRAGVDCANQSNVVVIGDNVIQLFLAPDLRLAMDKTYSSSRPKNRYRYT